MSAIDMRITHQAIADRVGVSRTVVTEALHRTPGARINTRTRRDILRAARQMGYQPRNLTTHNIGYILSIEEMKLETESSVLVQFEQNLRAQGYRLTLASVSDENPDELKEVLNPKTADGVIFSRWYGGKIKSLLSPRLPWVLISDEYGVEDDVDLIAIDTVQTTRNIAEYLLGKGHTKLGIIVGSAALKYHEGLILGAQQVLSEAGLTASSLRLIRSGPIEEISSHLLPIMEEADAPTALIVISPGRAIATQYALRSAGSKIPEDGSVVSVVDHERFRALPPVLTVTDALGPKFAAAAVKRLLEKIKNPDSPPQKVLLAGKIVERDSVGAPRKGAG
jgi:LacI family transcriptional regulator